MVAEILSLTTKVLMPEEHLDKIPLTARSLPWNLA
jgi:hypothetical protein